MSESLCLRELDDLRGVSSIVDGNGNDTGFGAVEKPLITRRDLASLDGFARDHRMIGVSGFGPFPRAHPAFGPVNPGLGLSALPGEVGSGDDAPYAQMCEAWAHCFRDPAQYLPPGRPRVLLSRSDFTDPNFVLAAAGGDCQLAKRWDLIYICDPHRFAEVTKNWDLARVCLRRLSTDLRLTALCVGRAGCRDLDDFPGVEMIGQLPWRALMHCIARSRIMFLPNVLDASPRVIAEALCLDVPILVNHAILGGWKYVTPLTGQFFEDDSDVVAAARACLSDGYAPRDWFCTHHGPEHASRVLRRLIELLSK